VAQHQKYFFQCPLSKPEQRQNIALSRGRAAIGGGATAGDELQQVLCKQREQRRAVTRGQASGDRRHGGAVKRTTGR